MEHKEISSELDRRIALKKISREQPLTEQEIKDILVWRANIKHEKTLTKKEIQDIFCNAAIYTILKMKFTEYEELLNIYKNKPIVYPEFEAGLEKLGIELFINQIAKSIYNIKSEDLNEICEIIINHFKLDKKTDINFNKDEIESIKQSIEKYISYCLKDYFADFKGQRMKKAASLHNISDEEIQEFRCNPYEFPIKKSEKIFENVKENQKNIEINYFHNIWNTKSSNVNHQSQKVQNESFKYTNSKI